MQGHVFLVHGDLTKLSCDAWLVPSGTRPGPGSIWRDAVSSAVPEGTPTSWADAPSRVIPWGPLQPGWPRPCSRPQLLCSPEGEGDRRFPDVAPRFSDLWELDRSPTLGIADFKTRLLKLKAKR